MFDDLIKGATLLVTGGTGSLGRAIVEEALKHDPRAIRLVSRNEYLQVNMRRALADTSERIVQEATHHR